MLKSSVEITIIEIELEGGDAFTVTTVAEFILDAHHLVGHIILKPLGTLTVHSRRGPCLMKLTRVNALSQIRDAVCARNCMC